MAAEDFDRAAALKDEIDGLKAPDATAQKLGKTGKYVLFRHSFSTHNVLYRLHFLSQEWITWSQLSSLLLRQM